MEESVEKAGSTRERLRVAAMQLFGERGFDGTSMAELAERVGIAKPSLYNYYRSKEELLLDLLEEASLRFRQECLAPLREAETFEQALRQYFQRVVRFAASHPHELVLYQLARIHLVEEVGAQARARLRAVEQEVEAVVDERLREAVVRGELPEQDIAQLHDFLRVFFHGLVFLHFPQARVDCCFARPVESLWPLLFRALSGRFPEEERTE